MIRRPRCNRCKPARNASRSRNFGLQPLHQGVEITERLRGQMQLLYLRSQTAYGIVIPLCQIGVLPQRQFHAHRWRWQAGFLEFLVEIWSYLLIATSANYIVNESDRCEP